MRRWFFAFAFVLIACKPSKPSQSQERTVALVKASGTGQLDEVKKLLAEDMEQCRFLVEPGNDDARSVHNALGARVVQEVQDFYQPGDTRLWSIIDRSDLDRVRERYTRLKLVS